MMTLRDILYSVALQEVSGMRDVNISGIVFDSRKVTHGTLFAAIKGTSVDGHRYIDKAITDGAIAVVCEDMPEALVAGVTYIKVDNAAKALGRIASNFYGNP